MDEIGYIIGYGSEELAEKLTVTVSSVVVATGANRNTAKAALQRLAKRGLIAQKGKGRGAYYALLS